jgi:hypothetical protein
MKTITFIRCAGVWILFTLRSRVFAIIRFSRLHPYDVWPFLSVVLAAVTEAGLSWSLVLEGSTPKKAILSGGGLGLGLPIVGAYLLQKAIAGMDNLVINSWGIACEPSQRLRRGASGAEEHGSSGRRERLGGLLTC